MGFFTSQLANVVEWEEYRDDQIFYKWHNNEIKKGSRLIIRPGQNAIFMYQGKIEGIFTETGEFDIESQIIPFLSKLKGFKFGFNTGMRAEVLFINTREFTIRWGTKQPINIPNPNMPGGMPIRANGTLVFKLTNYTATVERIAGVKDSYCVDDIKIRITSVLDQLLSKWIVKEGKDMFNIQANSSEIGQGIMKELDMNIVDTGISIRQFNIGSVTYPDEVQAMVQKNASYSMVGDMQRYSQMQMLDSLTKPSGGNVASGTARDMAGLMMGMQMAQHMMNSNPMSMPQQGQSNQQVNNFQQSGQIPNFCPNCGSKTTGANFCPNCGYKLC
jgi:membrane protease subunit (stomatin/prohibitin family)